MSHAPTGTAPGAAMQQAGPQNSHCIHYGACGGCATDNRGGFDKPKVLAAALARAGFIDAPIAPLVEIPLRTRRRAHFAAVRIQGGVALGLRRARGTDVIDMRECVLLEPRLFRLLAPLRLLLRGLDAFRRAGAVVVNLLDSGPDILLRLDGPASPADRHKMIAFAKAEAAVRISVAVGEAAPELVVMLNPPVITLSGAGVQPAPGAFLQATAAGEAAIIAAVLEGLPKLQPKSRVIELFAGVGTITFALARHARVEAYEGAIDAAAAQEAALRANNLAGRITLAQRDLTRRPLTAAELAGSAAIILDPPYAGAARQIPAIAAAAVPRLIYISCNPVALATDAFPLHRAGYKVLNATPIDQFPYSENLESVVVFGKSK